MKPWALRPPEEANLLNPAFCCVTLAAAVLGYASVDKTSIPYPLTFLVLPTVLHKATRENLPRQTRTSLAAWIQENAEVKVTFAGRVTALKEHTREAILFGSHNSWFDMLPNGRVQTSLSDSDADGFIRKLEGEAKECVRRARFVGRWFALAGTPQTVWALFGIRP